MLQHLAVQVLVPLIIRVHSHGRITENRLRTRRGHDNLFV